MADATLTAQDRTEFGKGAARRTRRAGLIPAVIHGAGDPIHISLPGHATTLALRHVNALMEITVGGDTVLTLAREIQRNPVRDTIEHVDLRAVRRGQKIEVEVPVRVHGEPLVGIAILDTQNLRIEVEATAIPEELVVDVDGLSEGETIRANQVSLPEGASLAGDEDHIIVSISVLRSELDDEVPEEGAAESESEEPAAE